MGAEPPCNFSTAAHRCNVGGLQAAVIIIPALLSLSTLLIVSCMLWKTCSRWSHVIHPSPPSPSGTQEFEMWNVRPRNGVE
ncbi:hypothetical protein VULLAG_LOCUS22891 [Vulpes lagopus]